MCKMNRTKKAKYIYKLNSFVCILFWANDVRVYYQ